MKNHLVAIVVVLSAVAFGCDSTGSLESQREALASRTTRLRADAEKHRRNSTAELARLKAEMALLEADIAKLNELFSPLNPTPQPVTPVVPEPVKPINPEPVKPVTPVVPPKPVNPEPEDGRFAVAKQVYRLASIVDSPDRVAECQALAAVFDSVAAQVAAGTLNGSLLNPQWHQISSALTAGNKPIIAKHLTAWNGPATQLGDAISKRYSDGKLDTNDDWSDLLKEIAVGLKAVK